MCKGLFMTLYKDAFPQSKEGIYLDSAATTLKLKKMLDAMYQFYLKDYATINRGVYHLSSLATEKYLQTRKAVQEFIHAQSQEEIVFTKNTTEAINLVALSFGELFNEHDEILLSEMEHHSNLIPWQMLAKRKNLALKFIPINEKGELLLDVFEKLLSEKTKLVSIAHIPNVTGTVNPVEAIIQKAHAYGAKVLLDGAQAVGHMPIDVQRMQVDFYCFSAHKMYGPNGVGVLYARKSLLEQMPPIYGGGDMIDQVFLDHATYLKPPARFESGTPAIGEVVAFQETLRFLNEIGMDTIHAYEQSLLQDLTEKLLEIPNLKIIGTAKEKGAIVSFVIGPLHPLDLASFLSLKKIAIRSGHICAQPLMNRFNISSIARASIGLYNTREDIDMLISSIKEICAKLVPF